MCIRDRDHFGIYAKGREKERRSRDPVLIGGAIPRTRRTRRASVVSSTVVVPAAATLRLRLPSRSALQYNLCLLYTSNNMAGEKISVEWVEDMLEFGELKELLETYVKFCKGEAVNPN